MRRSRSCFAILLLCLLTGAYALPIAPGVTYDSERVEEGPWEIRIVRVERGSRFIRLDVGLGQGKLNGVEMLSGIIARETRPEDYVVAAVNADFFVMAPSPQAGLVSSLTVRQSELLMTARSRPAFVMLPDGTPRIGLFETRATLVLPAGESTLGGLNQPQVKDSVCVYTGSFGWPLAGPCVCVTMEGLPLRTEGSWQGRVSAVSGEGAAREAGPGEVVLRADGTAASLLASLKMGDPVGLKLTTEGLEGSLATAAGGNLVLLQGGQLPTAVRPGGPRHPRTAVGFNNREVLLVTVDGRQPGWSMGMTYHELALLMQRLGCTDALNLDGGGSTTAWVRGKVVNRPSDGGQRRIANGLLVRSTAPHGPAVSVSVEPGECVALPGAVVPLSLRATDEWSNPVAIPADGVSVRVKAERASAAITARWTGSGLALAGGPGVATVSLHAGGDGVGTNLRVRLVRKLTGLKVSPATIALRAGGKAQLTCVGLSVAGEPVILPAEGVAWRVQGEGLSVSPTGELHAATAGTKGTVRAKRGQWQTEVAVSVKPSEK